MYSKIRDPYFLDVHYLKGTKERQNCQLCGKTVPAPSFVGRDNIVDSAEGLLALLDTVFFQDIFFSK